MSFWEEICIQVIRNVLPLLPRVVDEGFHDFGLDIPPFTSVELPDLIDWDTSTTLTGFCGLGNKDLGNAALDLEGSRLNGLDTIAQTPGETIRFTTPDEVMIIPLTVGKLSIASQFAMRHRCRPMSPQGAPEFTAEGKGSLTGSIEKARITMTIAGLDANKGRAGAVLLAWSSPTSLPELAFGAPQFASGTPEGARRTIENYLKIGSGIKSLKGRLVDQLTGVLSGAVPLGSRTLPGTLLEVINGAFGAVG